MKIGKIKHKKAEMITFVSSALTILFAVCVFAVSADKEAKAEEPEGMTLEQLLEVKKINYEGYPRNFKGPVPFSHQAHKSVMCMKCHHTGDYIQCGECHMMETEDEVVKLNWAFHRSCRGCHKELAEENPESKAPDRKCSGCHAKREK
ncbi:MAG: cytochrome c3 family protein [Desulfatiglandaceae bacterium]